jgi:signal transduction histidine kinase
VLFNLGQLDQEGIDCLKIINECSDSLIHLVEHLMDTSQIELGEIKIVNTEFNYKNMEDDIINRFSFFAFKKGLKLQSYSNFEGKEMMRGDELKIKQVLSNLINNSVKYTHAGSIKVRSKFKIYKNKKSLKVTIQDTGIGIEKENLKNIFEEFKQENNSVNNSSGYGLGLSIVKKLIYLMNGKIEITSQKHKGTKVYFEIPFML